MKTNLVTNNDLNNNAYIDECLSGKIIYGDDFKGKRLKRWFREEKEGYSELSKLHTKIYKYAYHALNWKYGFKDLKDKKFSRALALGAARGDELLPIQKNLNKVILVEPSKIKKFVLNKKKVRYVRPRENASLPFPDKHFDLIIALGVIHHIPRVSLTLSELGRVTLPGGILLIREPVTSMGDWRKLRPGLTKNERGIPKDLLRLRLEDAGFIIRKWNYVMFPAIPRIANFLGLTAYNSPSLVNLDALLCKMTIWNLKYNANNIFRKIRPTCVFSVLEKIN